MSSSEIKKPPSSKFSASRSGLVDFGTTEQPRWRAHRRMICAGLLPYLEAISTTVGFVSAES